MTRPRHTRIEVMFQLQNPCQFNARQHLQHAYRNVFVHCTIGNIGVTFRAWFQDQAKWFDLPPEGFVIHRFQPVFKVFNKIKHAHDVSLKNLIQRLQICVPMRGLA